MNRIFIAMLFFVSFFNCKANTDDTTCVSVHDSIYYEQYAKKLTRVYQKLKLFPHNAKNQQMYFDVFPNTFTSLNCLFGYPLDFKSPLEDSSYDYIKMFFNLEVIEKTKYFNKMIDISIDGKWDSDGVSYFMMGLYEKMESDVDIFVELLSKRTDRDIKSFWYFYLDTPAPNPEMPNELWVIEKKNSRVYQLMKASLKDVQKASKNAWAE
jgi:hypothetical protein